TEKVRGKGYCVMLFDEIEKGDGDVFNMLLEVVDDGDVSDTKGGEVDLGNSVIIMR
ncbi:AAA family ATPase, partial [Staphylococcus hominis]|uniref:AAA family ATPase n=1 Tax=Staphylococcus hominis TaxID=1290 RepID=UPI0011A7AB34